MLIVIYFFKELVLLDTKNVSLREKCPNKFFFSSPYFPIFSPNAGKYRPEKTPYLDTFHVVYDLTVSFSKYSDILLVFICASAIGNI